MRVLLQRVLQASVHVEGNCISDIGPGLLVLAGFESADQPAELQWTAAKIVQMRIFQDEQGLMNRSVLDTGGDVLLVSQFTLHAQTKKGNRPSFIQSARPEQAIPLYELFIRELETALGRKIYTGQFGADMKVSLINDGPVTIWIDSLNRS